MTSIVVPLRARRMSPGFIEWPDGRFSVAPMTEIEPDRQPEARDRGGGAQHGRAARHVELHVAHLVAGLDRDAAGVERHGLADEAEHRAGRARAVVAERDQLRLLLGALRDAGERAHAGRLDLDAAHHLERERVVAVGDLARALGQRGRREVVGGAVLEVAGEVDRLADDAPGLDRARRRRGGRRRSARRRRPSSSSSSPLGLPHREVVGAHHAALDERGGVRVGDVVGELPAQRARAELAGAGDHAAGDDPGALGVELVALAQPGDQPALAVVVRQRELAERRPSPRPTSTSAPSAPPAESCAIPSSSKRPTAIVSAPVPAGASVVARTSMRRREY